MNIFLLEAKDFENKKTAVLTGRRHRHACDILKACPGDEFKVGVLNGRLGTGRVLECREDFLRMNVDLTQEPPAKHHITLLLGLPRPPVLRRLLSAVTAMGVEKIVLMQTARVEKSYWNSPVLREENIRRALMLGLEQARDTVLPQVIFEQRFRPFMEKRLPELTRQKQCLIAHPENAAACPCDIARPIVLAAGPEGGFVDHEIREFCAIGFQCVTMGQRILRVETAVQALVGRMVLVD